MDIKEAVRRSMKQAGVSVTQMASELDVTKQSVSNTLNRGTAISVQKAVQMLDVTGHELVVRKPGDDGSEDMVITRG